MEIAYIKLPFPKDVKGYFLDCSQGPGFGEGKFSVATLHSNSLVFSFELETVINNAHKLALHGYPVSELELHKWSDGLLGKLAGDSFFLPNFGELQLAIFLNKFAPWWRRMPPAELRTE